MNENTIKPESKASPSLNKNMGMLWQLLGIILLIRFCNIFNYTTDVLQSMTTLEIYERLTINFVLGVGCMVVSNYYDSSKIKNIVFDVKISFYYLLGSYFILCIYQSLDSNAISIGVPPLYYILIIPMSVRTLSVFRLNQGVSGVQQIFQIAFIRQHGIKFILRMVMFLGLLVGLNELIDYIITQSNL